MYLFKKNNKLTARHRYGTAANIIVAVTDCNSIVLYRHWLVYTRIALSHDHYLLETHIYLEFWRSLSQ